MTILSLFLLIARGAVVLALALIGGRLLRRASASLRHAWLAAALAAVLALPVIAAIVPAWHAGALATDTGEAIVPALPVAEPTGPALAPATQVTAAPSATHSAMPWGTLAAAVWALGAAALLARAGIGAWRARRIAARGTPVEMDVEARVVASSEVDAPIVVGAFAPVVVVPLAAAGWTPERWRVVLLHELAHVRRRDGLANVIAQVACALHWFDPLVWIAARRMRVERELAADDAVLRGGARASTYAEHLLAIARTATLAPPAAALAMAGAFESRVVALLDGDRSRSPAGARRTFAVAFAATTVAAIAACVSPEAAPKHAEDTGAPVVAAKDPALQAVVDAELEQVMTAHRATGAVAIVLDAKTGAVLAMATRGDTDARAPRAPGSTLKPFTFAAALDAGVIDAGARIDCENGERKYGDKTMTDASPHHILDLGGILAVSSNVCTAKVAEPLGDRLGESLRRYHFSAPVHIDTTTLEGAAIAMGEGIHISALDLATGYTAFADDGIYHAPDGSSERVMQPQTARAIMAMLDRVVYDSDGTGKAARIDGVKVGGKTGTARSTPDGRYYASFVGIVPADAPRFIVLVGADGVTEPGGVVAAPAFAKIAARALAR